MGMSTTFICHACGYKAFVSGGMDTGGTCKTQTISCEKCLELFDAIVLWTHDWTTVQPRCPKRKSHPIKPWNHPDACPRCGTIMEVDEDGEILLWD